jgi:heme/copper-type cytochrome/quinol oxidase subunit 2
MTDEAAEQVRKLRMLIVYLVFAGVIVAVGVFAFQQRQADGKRQADKEIECAMKRVNDPNLRC